MQTLNWKPVINSLLRQLIKDGFTPILVDNGGGDFEPTPSVKLACKKITATDESELVVQSSDGKKWVLYIVLGNSPEETVSDCTCRDNEMGKKFADSIDVFSRRWEGKSCPTVEA